MITTVDELLQKMREKHIKPEPEEIAQMREVCARYPIRISEHYLNLIDWEDENCPIRKQAVPDFRELMKERGYSDDPLNEGRYEKVPFLVHKYETRAAFMCSNVCYMNCRHCTRKNTVMSSPMATEETLPEALAYVRENPQISDILITGGDPFALPVGLLEHYVAGFRSIPTVNTIRIGTRAIVVDPESVTDELADMLKRYHPIWIFTQFNHPKEVTEEAADACERLLNRGIPLGNQSVFLRGINDSTEVLQELFTKLIGIRVRPYYLYLCDRVNGTAHFYANYKRGIEIVEKLRYRLPGYAVPKFVIDADGENGGKVTIEENHILEEKDDCLILRGNRENTVTRFKL